MCVSFSVDKAHDFMPGTCVCTYSAGETRILRLRCIADESKVQNVVLRDDSLFILGWWTNQLWKHQIVRSTSKSVGPRISLTFRCISSSYNPITKQITMGRQLPEQRFDPAAVLSAPVDSEGAAVCAQAEQVESNKRAAANPLARFMKRSKTSN